MESREPGRLTRDAAEAKEACQQAAQAAERCASVCAEAGDAEMARCIHLCHDVADVSSLVARLVLRGSGSLPKLAQIAHDGCLTAADECARFDDDVCQVAQTRLRSCAQALEAMGSGGPADEGLEGVIHDQGGHSPFRHF